MLQANERLTRASVFQRAYSGRQSVSSSVVSLYVLPRIKPRGAKKQPQAGRVQRSPSMPLVGFVVSKKTLKNATERNRAKRRIREAYRLLSKEFRGLNEHERLSDEPRFAGNTSPKALSLDQWYAMVFVASSKALAAKYEEIEEAVAHCIAKANAKYGIGRTKSGSA